MSTQPPFEELLRTVRTGIREMLEDYVPAEEIDLTMRRVRATAHCDADGIRVVAEVMLMPKRDTIKLEISRKLGE